MNTDPDQVPLNRVVVHIGAHKTGTSLIQKFLRDQPEKVEAADIRYINRTDMNDYVAWGSHLIDDPDRFRGRILEEMRAGPTGVVVASHENTLGRPLVEGVADLYPTAPERAKALDTVLAGLDFTVVFYLRPIPSFLESYYLQTVHQGAYHSFDEWVSRYPVSEMTWRPVVETLYDTFGHERVVIGDFNDIKAGQTAFIDSFFAQVGLAGRIDPDYDARRNFSISGRGLELALRINPYLRTARERKQTRKFLQKRYSNSTFPRPVLFGAEEIDRLNDLFGEEYDELVRGLPAQ